MELKELICKRKSVRSYTNVPVDDAALQKIRSFIEAIKPLYPDIRVRAEIVDSDSVRCMLPWKTPQLVAFFSERADGDMENVGFCYQQLDLYLQSLGLGTCWLGMGKLNPKTTPDLPETDGLRFAMLMAFGHPKGEFLRKSTAEFKRRSLVEIADQPDDRLEPARLAPSSVNSQPWYFLHRGDVIHAYCVRSGFRKKKPPMDINRIDMGIALAHLAVTNPETFRFFRVGTPPVVAEYQYIGSLQL